jgi:hypothetical protein
MANATNIPHRPINKEKEYKILMLCLSVNLPLSKRLKKSIRIIVAPLLRLVATVLMPAAKIAAITKPVIPVGKPCTIK